MSFMRDTIMILRSVDFFKAEVEVLVRMGYLKEFLFASDMT